MIRVTVYKDNAEITVQDRKIKPTLKQMQKAVKGYIESVPEAYYTESNKDWFSRQHKGVIDAVYVNDDGLALYDKANPFFTPAPWGDSLYGNVLVIERIA